MNKISVRDLLIRGLLLALASVAPNAFPAAQAGYGSLHDFALYLILPAAGLLLVAWIMLRRTAFNYLADLLRIGAIAGAVATIALEAVRYPGFKLGFMPGNLPDLMGVLLLDRFALGPSGLSTLAGLAYHFWIGACFGIIFALIRFHLSDWWAVPYGVAIGVGFMVSPVIEGLGIGFFGVNFGWSFAATVITAHVGFGLALAALLTRLGGRASAA